MKVPLHCFVASILCLGLAPPASTAQQRGAVPIQEQTPGLLAEAEFPPAPARLRAMAEAPGARIVRATIERRGDRLLYTFDLEYEDRIPVEHVQIDAQSGQTFLVDYCVELDQSGELSIRADPEIVTQARVGYVAARDSALARFSEARLIESAFRVEQSIRLFVFDIQTAGQQEVKQVLVDAYTGRLVPMQP